MGMYRQDVKRIYNQIGNEYRKMKQAQEQSDHKQTMDMVNNPPHYNKHGIECIDAIQASMSDLEFCGYLKGKVQKYVWRYDYKGKKLQDLGKAKWYLARLEKEVEKQNDSTS